MIDRLPSASPQSEGARGREAAAQVPSGHQTRLTIITTRPERAMRQVFGADMAVPSWIRIVSDPADCAGIPDAMRCVGIFYEPRGRESALEKAWQRRRRLGSVVGLTAADLAKLKDWSEKRGMDVDRGLRDADASRALSGCAPGAAITGMRHLEAAHG